MSRPGGYTSFHAAYARLLLADSRPLDSSSANRLPPGMHQLRVVEVEWNWGWIRLTLEGRARRRLQTHRIWTRDKLWKQLGCTDLAPGQLSAVELRLLGKELQGRVVDAGQVDLRICPDGSLIGVDDEGNTETYRNLDDAEAHLDRLGLTRKGPRLIEVEIRCNSSQHTQNPSRSSAR